MGTVRSLPLLLLSLLFSSQVSAQQTLSGTVIDSSGSALPRVAVHLVDAQGAEVAATFTDARGAFTFARACAGCTATITLPGFNPARESISAETPATIRLTVAPISEAVVVTATRTEMPTGELGADVTVISSEDIARRDVPTVADLLRATPGATVVRSGGVGSVTSLFVRGGESSYNKVLLDGIPMNEPGGTFNFSNLSSDFVDRIEVVRGAQSALYGSDAMTSVVQIVSRRAPRGLAHPSVLASGEAGSYGSQRGSASIGAAQNRWDGDIHVGREQTNNRVPNNAFSNTTVAGNGGVMPTANASLRLVGRTDFGRTGVPGATAFGRPDMDAFSHRRDGVIGATFNQQLSSRWQQRATYALSISHQQSTNLKIDPDYTPQFGASVAPFAFSDFPYDSLTDLWRHYASYQADARVGNASANEQLVTLAFDWNGERGVLTDRMAASVVRASRNNFGWTVQHQWLGAHASLSSGLRIEKNDSFGTTAAPRLSFAYVVNADTKLKANVGLGVKEPTIIQSFSPSPFFLGNPALEPERATTSDVGIEQRLFHQRLKIDASWFDGSFKNIISTRTTSFNPFTSQYFNIGLTKAHGAELALEAAPVPAFRLRGAYTLDVSRIAQSTSPSNAVFAVDAWAFRRPRNSGYVEAIITRARVGADLHGTFIGRRVDSDFSSLVPALTSNNGYATWDGGGSFRVAMPLSLYVRVDNIGNRDYMEPLGYPAWKRTARAGLRIAW